MKYIIYWMAIGYITNMIVNRKFYWYFNATQKEDKYFLLDITLGPLGPIGWFIGWIITKIDKDFE